MGRWSLESLARTLNHLVTWPNSLGMVENDIKRLELIDELVYRATKGCMR